ncbi:hypothetical protein GOP47_0007301 [Adiantum capillus-veneris]|uniref:glycerophosphodiester phosphodiesterase n=1 Tax=Adiantum capillus-veneris TaxID=13818 RepID=A0A9D4V196_ADICA|nr:hypothetical protein GOP47_0007301 [Adiantum capillus-veneris]
MEASCSLYSGSSMQSLLTGVRDSNPEPRVAIIGHRGCGKNIVTAHGLVCDGRPSVMENTIVSFNLAASNGADFVEFDVQVTKDGHPVIFHDDFMIMNDKKLDCLLHKRICDMTLEEFTQVGFRKEPQRVTKPLYRMIKDGSYSPWNVSIDDSLCTLEQAFAQVSPLVGFNIELKFDDFNHIANEELRRVIDAVLKVVKESNRGRKVFFSSFHPDAIILLRQEQSFYPALFLTNGVSDKYPDSRRNSLMAAVEVCLTGNLQGIVSEVNAILQLPEVVETIKAAGLTLLTYGDLNNVAEIFHFQESLGVDGVIVDHVPEMVLELLKNKALAVGLVSH